MRRRLAGLACLRNFAGNGVGCLPRREHVTESEQRKTQPYGAIVARGHLRLTIAAGPCPAGLSFTLPGPEHVIGRAEGDLLLSEDPTVSTRHARVTRQGDAWALEDMGSANGVWTRVHEPRTLTGGEMFRVGRQFFRFEPLKGDQGAVTEDGTQFFASPPRKGAFRVLQILDGGVPGQASAPSGDELTIGVTGTTIAFAADPNLSGRHARVVARDGGWFLEDLGSSNGTWIRVPGATIVAPGDAFFLGNTLLRADVAG